MYLYYGTCTCMQAVLWCSASLRPLARLHGHMGRIHALSFNPRSTLLASAGDDCSLRLWRVPGGEQQAHMRFNLFGFTWQVFVETRTYRNVVFWALPLLLAAVACAEASRPRITRDAGCSVSSNVIPWPCDATCLPLTAASKILHHADNHDTVQHSLCVIPRTKPCLLA